jgi:hypothetical protein
MAQVRSYRMALMERVIDSSSMPSTKKRTVWKNRRDFSYLQSNWFKEIKAAHPPPHSAPAVTSSPCLKSFSTAARIAATSAPSLQPCQTS